MAAAGPPRTRPLARRKAVPARGAVAAGALVAVAGAAGLVVEVVS